MTPREFQDVRDSLFSDGAIFQKSHNLSDTLIEMDMVYPFADSQVDFDSINAENYTALWKEMNKMAKKLSSKLNDKVHADDNVFTAHHGFKIAGVGKGEAVKYTPFTLELDDGQVLTALAKNIENAKTIKPNKDLMITHFMLNKKDITRAIYKNGETDIDVAQTVARLKTVIEASHRKFVSKNPIKEPAGGDAKALRDEIQAMEIDFNNVVEDEKPEQTFAEWEGEITAGLEEALDITTSDAQGMVEAQNFLLKQSWGAGETPDEVIAKIVALGNNEEDSDIMKIAKAIHAFKVAEGRTWKSNLKASFESQQFDHKHAEYKDALIRFRNRYDAFGAMDKIKPSFTVEDILALLEKDSNSGEDEKGKLILEIKDFVEKYFGGTVNMAGKTILRNFLMNKNMGNPSIGDPSIFRAGLQDAGVMADNETFMTGFQNLRDLFYGKFEREEEPETKEIITPNMVRGIDKTGEDSYLISYSSEYSETPEYDTVTLAEAKEIFKDVSEEAFRYDVIPYLEGAEADELVADIYGAKANPEEEPTVSIKKKLKTIKPFMGKVQYSIISKGTDKEEYAFNDEVDRLYNTITTMPKTYEQDGKGDKAVVYLHYFNGGSDWYITEKDMGDEQVQAFGYAILNGDTQNAELGYVSIEEITKLGVELDFHWGEKTLGEVKGTDSEEETKNEMPPFKNKEGGREFTNITEEDMEVFKEELENFETDDFVTVGEFADAYKQELSQYTNIDLFREGVEYAEQAQAIEEAQRALFGSSINDKSDGLGFDSVKKKAEDRGLDVIKEGSGYAVLKVENVVLSVHLARFTTIPEVADFIDSYDEKFYKDGKYDMEAQNSANAIKDTSIVDDINNGEIINDNFFDWKKIKTEADHKAWEEKVRALKFGTYENNTILDIMDAFNPKKGFPYDDYVKEVKKALEKEDTPAVKDFSLIIDATTADEFEAKLDELVENLETAGQLEEYEDELNKLADQLTEMMKSENS